VDTIVILCCARSIARTLAPGPAQWIKRAVAQSSRISNLPFAMKSSTIPGCLMVR